MIHVLIIIYIYRIMVVILYAGMDTWKVLLVVDISTVKNWFGVYWIIKRIKYTLFYWLIKEHWILSCCIDEKWVLCDVGFSRKGDFGMENFLWDRCRCT